MKIQHLISLVVLSLLTVPGARAAVLAGPLTNAANAHTYYLFSPNNWTNAEAEAHGLGGHLVTINDAAENQWVLNTFFPLIVNSGPDASLWIGLNDAANEGQFVWASGEPVTFTYWYPGEPNNLGGEDYAAIRNPSQAPPTGSWNDTDGLNRAIAQTFGVVEVSPPPPPLPVAVTQPADQFMPGSARLNGQANPNGSPTLAWFEWGTSLAYGNVTPLQSVGSGSNAVGLSNVIVGLVSGTDYHFRARASNAFGAVSGADQTFKMRQRAAVLAGPITNAASGHLYYLLSANTWTASEAEARGLGGHLVTINDAAENQWVLNTFFPLTGVPYSSLWIGLNDAANEGQFVWANGEPVTFTYWYPGVGGEDYAAIRHPSENWPTGSWKDLSDTSGLQNPTAPTFGVVELTVAVTLPADQFMPGSARLNGLANPSGSPTWVWFEWGTSLAYGNATPPQSVGSGSNFVTCSNVLVGLVSRTDYHFRTRASNAFGLFAGVDKTFNLNAQLPGVTTLAADQLTTTSVRLKGQVNPRDWATAAWFEWGTNSSYGNLIGMQDVGQGSSVSNIAVVLNGLMAGPDYHYRLVATNAYGPEYGADQTFNLGVVPTNTKWTGADPSGYWSAPANWFPNGVPTNGADLVFLGGLPPGEMVSTNDLADSIFRSIRFQAGGHTIHGNPITLTNRSDCIINSGTNVIACDLTFTGTPSTPTYEFPSIRPSGFPDELTVIGNVGGGSLYVSIQQLVIRGQFTGGSIRVVYGSLALHGDNPHPVSAEILGTSFNTLRVQGSQPNLNIAMLLEMEIPSCPTLTGDGVVGDVAGCGQIDLNSTLSVKNLRLPNFPNSRGILDIHLNGTNVGEYGRLISSGDVSLSSGRLLPSAGFNPQAGQVYTIVEKTSLGPIANAIFGPEGTITTLNGMPFRISYVGGDGNDVTLTVVTPAPIVLGAVQRFGTQFVFSYSADVGLPYAVERSATWSNWTTIRSDTANVNPMTFTDTAATNRMNFYRVRRLPNP